MSDCKYKPITTMSIKTINGLYIEDLSAISADGLRLCMMMDKVIVIEIKLMGGILK